MRRFGRRALSLLLAAALLLVSGAGEALARTKEYPSVRIYSDGLLTGRAYRYGEEVYLSVADVCAFLGLEAEESYDRETFEVSLEAEGLSLSAKVGQIYMEVNGRWLLNLRGILIAEGRPFFPVVTIEKIFGLRAELTPEKDRMELELRGAALLQGGESYYEETFGKDNVLWLSRLICAETKGQPFSGRVGVGNVVLNRVASDKFPDTILGVIFDTKNGIQFAPVYEGTIYDDADRESVIAACIALEGYKTVGDSLFFVDPAHADDQWLRDYYGFVTRIGSHDFYQ